MLPSRRFSTPRSSARSPSHSCSPPPYRCPVSRDMPRCSAFSVCSAASGTSFSSARISTRPLRCSGRSCTGSSSPRSRLAGSCSASCPTAWPSSGWRSSAPAASFSLSPTEGRLPAEEEFPMTIARVLAALALCVAFSAAAQQKEIKIGFIYDVTGPFAGGGSEPAQIGTKAAVDYFNERGGVAGYKINAIFVDAQSKVDVAINEMTRLLDQEKVDLIMGVYSSAQCVPMVQQVDSRKKFLWLNVCIATAVFKDKKLSYVFRPQAHSDQFGAASCDYVNHYAQSKFGAASKNLRIAIIHEDGPYGVGVAAGNEAQCKKHGMNIVLKEGYSATAPDLSSLVTKVRRARPDVLLHTGYNPDITLFLRQSKEQGLKVKAIIGHGAGHSQIDKLRQTFGDDVNYFHSIDPAAAQLLDAKTLKPGIAELTKEMVKRYEAVKGP